MSTLLVKDAKLLVTMDDDRRRIPGGGMFVENNVIREVGPTAELPVQADLVLDVELEITRGVRVLEALLDSLPESRRNIEQAALHEGIHG